ncbi:MAG: 4Fe-4S dicluster domain-containing protein [Rikenellaceae bacterium]
MNRLRGLRVTLAVLFLVMALLLFVDFTGTIHTYMGWLAKIQFIPALLGLHVGVVLGLFLLTLIFGRLYCSVICPLGLFQDAISRFASMTQKKRKFSYSPAKSVLRYIFLAIFVVSFIAGLGSIVALLEPYSAFGRMVSTLLAPLYKSGNNILAYLAERVDSYAFYTTDILMINIGMIVISILTFLIVGYLAWRNGRTYCNTVCPVGTILGFVSRFSILKIVVDNEKCNGCRKCVRACKSSCITATSREIDYSRCVVCFNCIDSCNQGAITYGLRAKKSELKVVESKVDSSKRNMLAISATLLATSALKAEEKMVDGGLATIEDKKIPLRQTPIVPAGAGSLRNFSKSCTGCQLCVTVCPNQVLRPATGLTNFMQPEMSYERGYCRPECTKCSEVCPAGAINKIDRAEKSSTQIGHAVWIEKNCVVLTDEVKCGNCAAHCPTGAIRMVLPKDKERYGDREIPVVNIERCIGCGACENLCPARPFSAIYVEGHTQHKTI